MRTSIEGARGCGYRVAGALYLVSDQLSEPCPRLPLPLDRCPHCGQGIGPARGWTWITPAVLFPAQFHGGEAHNAVCPLGIDPMPEPFALTHTPSGGTIAHVEEPSHRTGDRAGLIWVGEKFYRTPADFMAEAATMGVSRRIKAVPRGFVIGKQWVYLGHRKAIDHSTLLDPKDPSVPLDHSAMVSSSEAARSWPGDIDDRFSPGVITLFKPRAIEYIVKGDETDEQLEDLEKRGITPAKVIRDVDAEAELDQALELVP